jgi:hypothetical protein
MLCNKNHCNHLEAASLLKAILDHAHIASDSESNASIFKVELSLPFSLFLRLLCFEFAGEGIEVDQDDEAPSI